MNKSLFKAILSTMLLLALLLISLTGFALYFNSTGQVLGLPRYVVRQIHAICAMVMLGAGLLHFALNLKTLRAEWRQGRRKNHEE